ncbi:MAG TPA: helix-hairpin-helix domain-containing protein [Trinickia sp.]|jgi:competence protein ComEA|nr:helix-hairpin-helix domain-containing protein [Trinickia sp.]
MLKKLLMLFIAVALSLSTAFAASVDVNTADQAALESVKGLGPVKSKAIIDERSAHGPFKDADDLARRVKGLGAKSVANLESQGLTIGGSSAPPTGAGAKKAPSVMSQGGDSSGGKTAKGAPAQGASSSAAGAAGTMGQASDAKGSKSKKKGKAASGAAASGG